jgi:hypothetical protein
VSAWQHQSTGLHAAREFAIIGERLASVDIFMAAGADPWLSAGGEEVFARQGVKEDEYSG